MSENTSEIVRDLPIQEALSYAHPQHWGGKLPEEVTWSVPDDKATWATGFDFLRKVIDGQVELGTGKTYAPGQRFQPMARKLELHGSVLDIDNEMLVVYGQHTLRGRKPFRDITPPATVDPWNTGLDLGGSRMIPIPILRSFLLPAIDLPEVDPTEPWPTLWYVRHRSIGIIVRDAVRGGNALYRTVRWPHEKPVQFRQNPPAETDAAHKISTTVGRVYRYNYLDTGIMPAQLLWRDNRVTLYDSVFSKKSR